MTAKLGGIETEYTDWGTPAIPALRQLRQEDFEYPESQSDPDFFIPGDGVSWRSEVNWQEWALF